MTQMNTPLVPLGDGAVIPQLGFGTFKVPPDDTERAVTEALRVGYRHIDTAALYNNESGVGAAIAASGIPRDQLFVTTKLWNDQHDPDRAWAAINASLEKLRLDFVDLYLIHWPAVRRYGDTYIAAWDALQQFKQAGLATSIGVCNFSTANVDALRGEKPAVNQFELHPTLAQVPLRTDMAQRGIAIESWAPLGQGADLSHPVVLHVAAETERTPAQVVLRWHLQHGFITIPKSVTPARIAENARSLDFELTGDQMEALDGLDAGNRLGSNPETADF